MKKILSLFILTLSLTAGAEACCYRGGYYHHGYYGGGWVAPALVGGVIGYEMAQPRTVIVEQPPAVVYTQPPMVVQQPGYAPPPAGYHYQQMVNPQTNQYQLVLVPN
jgi:hypothetical protein